MHVSHDAPVSLVTGCSSGIGRALALELAGRGQRCFATARRLESLAPLAERGLDTLRLDVCEPDSVREAVAALLERAGRIDLVVNNAGQSLFGPLAELPLERFDAVVAVNLRGPLVVAQAVIPAMARQGRGRIAMVGSMVGVVPTPWVGAYAASKAALHTLSDALRMEVAPFGIEVISVQPGGVRSEVASNAPFDAEHYARPEGLYRAAVEAMRKRSRASQDAPMEAEEFARRVADALTRPRAPRVVRVGRGARFLSAIDRLPGAWRDRLFARAFGLGSLSGDR